MKDNKNIARSVCLLGQLYEKQEDYFNAINKFKEVMELEKDNGNKEQVAFYYLITGRVYLKSNNPGKAIQYALKSLKIAKEIGAKDNMKNASEILSKSYASLSDYKKAYQYQVLFKELNDSIFTLESKKKITEIENRFELEKKEKELFQQKIKLNQKDLEILHQRNGKNFMISVFAIVSIIFILIFFLVKFSIQKREHKLKEALYMNMQQTLSQQMNPHFIFNTLNSIQNYIYKNNLEESMVYLSNFACLMRKILSISQNYTIPLYEEIDMLKSYCELESRRFDHSFEFKIDIDEKINSHSYKIPIFLLQPLIENAIKHGLEPTKTYGLISLKIVKNNEGIRCRIEDNGVGLKPVTNKVEAHVPIAGSLIQKRLNILSLYYKKKFNFSMYNLISDSGDILGFVSEISLPVIE